MKLTHIMALFIALIIAPFAAFGRAFFPQGIDAVNTQGTHADITRSAEVAIAAHLLVAPGTAPGTQVKLCTAALEPLGFAYDTAAINDPIGVELIGGGGGTRLGIASKAIPAAARVYATAGGKVTDAVVVGAYLVGRALTAAAADGDEIEIMPLSPVVNPA